MANACPTSTTSAAGATSVSSCYCDVAGYYGYGSCTGCPAGDYVRIFKFLLIFSIYLYNYLYE